MISVIRNLKSDFIYLYEMDKTIWGFREVFYKSVDDLQTEYKSNLKNLFSDYKVKVDEFMFDLTDYFSDEKTSR